MLVAAPLRIEPLTARKSIGLVLAMGGVVIALAASLSVSPPGAWRGDAMMLAGAVCMALYTIWSRPLIRRSGPIAFAVSGMMIGAVCWALLRGRQAGSRPRRRSTAAVG